MRSDPSNIAHGGYTPKVSTRNVFIGSSYITRKHKWNGFHQQLAMFDRWRYHPRMWVFLISQKRKNNEAVHTRGTYISLSVQPPSAPPSRSRQFAVDLINI